MDEDRCRVRDATCILFYTSIPSSLSIASLSSPRDFVIPHISRPFRLNILQHVRRSEHQRRSASGVFPAALKFTDIFQRVAIIRKTIIPFFD